MGDLYQTWQSQMRKGYLELCVMLSLKSQGSSYGFSLLQSLEAVGLIVNEGTLYPLLNRMNKNGWLDSDWRAPTDGGHPRRFYKLSSAGEKALPKMVEQSIKNQAIIDKLGRLQ